jgi:hypothetical protein
MGTPVTLLATAVIVAFGLFLIALTGVVIANAPLAERFLMSFASSARTHYAEQAVRMLVGVSLVVLSPAMWQTSVFRVVGWATVISSAVLILLPWRLHQRFGLRVLPVLVRHMRLYAFAVFAFGALLLYAVFADRGTAQ